MGDEEADCRVIMAADVEERLVRSAGELRGTSSFLDLGRSNLRFEVGTPSRTGRGR